MGFASRVFAMLVNAFFKLFFNFNLDANVVFVVCATPNRRMPISKSLEVKLLPVSILRGFTYLYTISNIKKKIRSLAANS